MEFNKQVFKKYYGKNWITAMYVELLILLIAMLMTFFNHPLLIAFSVFTVGSMAMVILPFSFCMYIRRKKQSERQKQWIKNGKLYVKRGLDDGFSLGGMVHHDETVLFNKIVSICVEKRFIVVKGEIQIIENYNGVVRQKDANIYKIPRNFSNEKEIIQLGEKRNG